MAKLLATNLLELKRHGRIATTGLSLWSRALWSTTLLRQQKNKTDEEVPRNYAGIQMIHPTMRQQLFPHDQVGDRSEKLSSTERERVKEHLRKFGLWNRIAEERPAATAKVHLPPLLGNDLEEHFEESAREQSRDHMQLAVSLTHSEPPEMPKEWVLRPGWTKYNPDGSIESVEAPPCKALVFDVEVCVREGHYPTLAVAASPHAWYGWVSKRLANYDETTEAYYQVFEGPGFLLDSTPGTRELIPLEPQTEEGESPRIVIGHNVAYDRQRVLEQYNLAPSATRFIDTMSLHMATSGLSTQQDHMWRMRSNTGDIEKDAERSADMTVEDGEAMKWTMQSAPPSLEKCYKLWCGKTLDKESRKVFVHGSMTEIFDSFQSLMGYCAQDVFATYHVFKQSFSEYIFMFPSAVTFAGMLEVGQSFLPTDQRWKKYLRRCQLIDDELHAGLEELFVAIADKEVTRLTNSSWMMDPWLRNLDWSFKSHADLDYEPRLSYINGEPLELEYGMKFPGKASPPDPDEVAMLYIPKWYRRLFGEDFFARDDFEEAELDRTINMNDNILPYLLKLAWKEQNWKGIGDPPEYPVYYHREHKWGYLVPVWIAAEHDGIGPYAWESLDGRYHTTHQFFKVPTNDGTGGVCGNLLAKECIDYAMKDMITCPYDFFLSIYDVEDCTYWNASRDRIMKQFVVWESHFDDKVCMRQMTQRPKCTKKSRVTPRELVRPSRPDMNDWEMPVNLTPKQAVILPQVVPFGTVTRRAVERTWLTAANPSPHSVGSELKSRIRAPPGYKFVGADVDSQELWIAAVLGDAAMAKSHGSTALGWMTLQGQKSDGTDMHSKTASISGITRDQAKILNYARIYGAAEGFAARLLHRFNPNSSAKEAKERAADLYSSTKGVRGPANGEFDFNGKCWEGGSESYTYNRLEQISQLRAPATPVLRAQISTALQPKNFGKQSNQFIRSRSNWAVQSSAVDYLHLLIVSMSDFIKRYDIEARYCISIHDEIRYIVAEEDVDRAAYALHLSNMLVRARFAHALGIHDLPESVAFFSAVDIDHIIRKEVYLKCLTPSNMIPEGAGESVDIHTVGERVGWDLKKK